MALRHTKGGAGRVVRQSVRGGGEERARIPRVMRAEDGEQNEQQSSGERVVSDENEPEKPMVSDEMREKLKQEYVSVGGSPNRPLRNNPFLLISVVICPLFAHSCTLFLQSLNVSSFLRTCAMQLLSPSLLSSKAFSDLLLHASCSNARCARDVPLLSLHDPLNRTVASLSQAFQM